MSAEVAFLPKISVKTKKINKQKYTIFVVRDEAPHFFRGLPHFLHGPRLLPTWPIRKSDRAPEFFLQIVLNSMHRYQPRVHVIRSDDVNRLPYYVTSTFSFAHTVFFTVTAYQNNRVCRICGIIVRILLLLFPSIFFSCFLATFFHPVILSLFSLSRLFLLTRAGNLNSILK